MATPKKTATSATTKKPSRSTKPAPPAPAKKRTRNSKPLFATMTLMALRKLLGDKGEAEVTVSRNFVLDIKRKQLEVDAAKDLGI